MRDGERQEARGVRRDGREGEAKTGIAGSGAIEIAGDKESVTMEEGANGSLQTDGTRERLMTDFAICSPGF